MDDGDYLRCVVLDGGGFGKRTRRGWFEPTDCCFWMAALDARLWSKISISFASVLAVAELPP